MRATVLRSAGEVRRNEILMTPSLRLNNKVELPALGFGVFQTPPEETTAAVAEALHVGYRLIDTAAAYGNEREAGEGICCSGVSREEVFIETKIWINDYGKEATLHGFEKSADKLEVEQLDLLILHQPVPTEFDRTIDAYRALEDLLADGKVRAIGVSNFMPEHLKRLLAETSVFCGEPDRAPSVLPATRTAAFPRRPRHCHPSVVADRRDHLLPRRGEEHVRGPHAFGDRRYARQVGRPGHASLASAGGPLGYTKIDHAGPHP